MVQGFRRKPSEHDSAQALQGEQYDLLAGDMVEPMGVEAPGSQHVRRVLRIILDAALFFSVLGVIIGKPGAFERRR